MRCAIDYSLAQHEQQLDQEYAYYETIERVANWLLTGKPFIAKGRSWNIVDVFEKFAETTDFEVYCINMGHLPIGSSLFNQAQDAYRCGFHKAAFHIAK